MTRRLDIDSLRALRAIRTHGGVTRAARELGLSQSAVSHKIRRLEETLECALLARRAGGPLLTEAGERLCDYAARILGLHDEALADLAKKRLGGTIRLGITEDVATSAIAGSLGRFARLHPAVTVRIRTGQSLQVQSWMEAGRVDLGVMQVFAHDVRPGDRVLFGDTLHWVRSRDFELDLSRPVPFLSFDGACFYRQWGFAEGLPAGITFEKLLECPSAAGISAAVRAGLGVALLNGLHLTPDMEVMDGIFPTPPELRFVARTLPGSRSAPVLALMNEIARAFDTPHAEKRRAMSKA